MPQVNACYHLLPATTTFSLTLESQKLAKRSVPAPGITGSDLNWSTFAKRWRAARGVRLSACVWTGEQLAAGMFLHSAEAHADIFTTGYPRVSLPLRISLGHAHQTAGPVPAFGSRRGGIDICRHQPARLPTGMTRGRRVRMSVSSTSRPERSTGNRRRIVRCRFIASAVPERNLSPSAGSRPKAAAAAAISWMSAPAWQFGAGGDRRHGRDKQFLPCNGPLA